MTRFDPSLFVRRLVVTRGTVRAFDQAFHSGLNVIRGANSTGKSTIANLLFFGLGGEDVRFTPEALLCDNVYVEAELNGAVVTLKREIDRAARRPMAIFWGPADDGFKRADQWTQYPFATTDSKEGFSAVLFRALGLPTVRGDLAARLTMHQLLRLMYVDQMSPVQFLLRADHFDSDLARKTIGTFLCGIHEPRLYEVQLELRARELELAAADHQVKILVPLFADAEQQMSVSFIDTQIENKSKEASSAREALQAALAARWDQKALSEKTAALLKDLDARVRSVASEVLGHERDVDRLQFEIADSALFLLALRGKLRAMQEAATVVETVGAIPFATCPACYKPLENVEAGHCAVCKSKLEAHPGSQLARMRQEIDLQIHESVSLQDKRLERLSSVTRALEKERASLARLRDDYARARGAVDDKTEVEVAALSTRVGYLDRELEDLARQRRLAQSLANLSDTKARLSAAISKLKDEITKLEAGVADREADAGLAISKAVIEILRRDLPREEVFTKATRVDFDFAKNFIAVNGKSVFSASSDVVLKNAFHLGVLIASCTKQWFRYPRFLLIDNIEDKGMQEERSHNFQDLLAEYSERLETEHQIIVTTSMPNPALEPSGAFVGDPYTPSRKTLAVPAIAFQDEPVSPNDDAQ
jgi:hypothetical protein